jgi:hypothetical protein
MAKAKEAPQQKQWARATNKARAPRTVLAVNVVRKPTAS